MKKSLIGAVFVLGLFCNNVSILIGPGYFTALHHGYNGQLYDRTEQYHVLNVQELNFIQL